MRRTVEIAPAGPRPSIRLRPVPLCEPPFDDELEPAVWATAHQLALDWSPSTLRRLAAPPPAPAPPPIAGASHDAKLAVRRFMHLCLEVLNGYRPAAHLRRLSLPSAAADIVAQGLTGARRLADLRKAAAPAGRRPTRRPP